MGSDNLERELENKKLQLEEKKLQWEVGTKIGTTIVAAIITAWLATYLPAKINEQIQQREYLSKLSETVLAPENTLYDRLFFAKYLAIVSPTDNEKKSWDKFSNYIQDEIDRLREEEQGYINEINELEKQLSNPDLDSRKQEEIRQKKEKKENEWEKFRQRYHL